jgi:DNA-binding NarL/FixJ family response regulator
MPVTVSIIDGEKHAREALELILRSSKEFYSCGHYATGHVALNRILRLKPKVVFMAFQLPDLSGPECTRRLRAILPNVKILITNNESDLLALLESLQAGANGFLTTPIAPDFCIRALHRVLSGLTVLSPEIAGKLADLYAHEHAAPQALQLLTPRERGLMRLLCQSLGDKQIADKMGLSVHTVQSYLKHIYPKLHVHSRLEAAQLCQKPAPATGSVPT